MSLVAA